MIGLRFTDGTTTVTVSNLTTGILTGYTPGNAPKETAETNDQAAVTLLGNRASVTATLELLNGLFEQAKERKQRPAIGKVWVERDNGDGVWWRSELVDANVLLEENSIDRLGRSTPITISLQRKNYWEGAEAQIPLTNGNGANNTTGLRVYNCSDGTGTAPNIKHNWVQIAADAVTGDLPAPMRLEMANSYDSTSRLYQLWMGLNVKSQPATFQHILEGEAAAYGGTTVANVNYSSGAYRDFTWSGDNQVLMGRWTLSSDFLAKAGGFMFKVLAVFALSPSGGTRLQCKTTFPSGTPLTKIGSSQEVGLSGVDVQDIGTLQLPPWLVGSGDLAPIDLSIYCRRTGGGFLALDYLQITPMDGYRVLRPKGYGVEYGEQLVDDGIEERLYTIWQSPVGKTGIYTGTGKMLLEPKKAQRLYITMQNMTSGANVEQQITVKAFYRPRKLSI